MVLTRISRLQGRRTVFWSKTSYCRDVGHDERTYRCPFCIDNRSTNHSPWAKNCRSWRLLLIESDGYINKGTVFCSNGYLPREIRRVTTPKRNQRPVRNGERETTSVLIDRIYRLVRRHTFRIIRRVYNSRNWIRPKVAETLYFQEECIELLASVGGLYWNNEAHCVLYDKRIHA